ncbi:MAG: metallophosphoesterase [Blastocatellia bacterium]|nr:metallophosphoesterase [Blastocatellia bacterium]
MRIFALGDLHLEGGTGKTMDRFGESWRGHDRKIFGAWQRTGRDDDLLLLVGDISWAMRLEDAAPDLYRIGQMKGLKIMLKGNHDYWWQSRAKMNRVLDASIKILQADSIVVDRVAVAGTRGWICPDDSYFEEHDAKIYEREVGRLRLALESLKKQKSEFDSLIVALHYPPVNDKHEPNGFTELIDEYGADACVYGHLHGEAIKTALTGLRGRTLYYLVSADAVDFAPAEIKIIRTRRTE